MSLIDYISTLKITQGAGSGALIRLLPWQRRFLRGAFGVEGDAALSVARGNGKSTLVAAIACAVVAGPLRQSRAEVVCVASSFAQGRVIFEHVLAFLDALGRPLTDRRLYRVQDSQNVATIEHRATGARIRCIGSDPKRAHGLAPLLVLADEPAQWEPAKRDAMRAALATAMGKLDGSRLIALGTRPADDEHWFAKMLDGGADYAQCHAARETDPPFRKRTWLRANPSLPAMPALSRNASASEADKAKRDDSLLAGFKALRLNLGTDDTAQSTLPGCRDLAANHGRRAACGPVHVWGLDLGQSEAMAGCAAYWPATGRLEALASFPNEPGLAERGVQDGVGNLYVRMFQRAELVTTGGEATDIAEFLKLCAGAIRTPECHRRRPMAGERASGHLAAAPVSCRSLP